MSAKSVLSASTLEKSICISAGDDSIDIADDIKSIVDNLTDCINVINIFDALADKGDLKFALNVFLLACGERNAYLENIDNVLLNKVLSLVPSLAAVPISYETLLFKQNKKEGLTSDIKSSGYEYAVGKLLGYRYLESDFNAGDNRVIVLYLVTGTINNKKVDAILYSYMFQGRALEAHRDAIESDALRFENVLRHLGELKCTVQYYITHNATI